MPAATRKKDETVERYAVLHRAVESGTATDTTRRQLVLACIELDKEAEAVDTFHAIADPAVRRACRRELSKKGWVSPEHDADERESLMVTEAMFNPSLREKFGDAVQLLYDDNMRPPVLVGTMAFPVVLCAGGILTAGSTFFLQSILALVPALFLLGMLGALARHVLIVAIQGRDDMDDLPSYRELVRESWAALADVVVLGLVFLGPPALLIRVGAPLPGLGFLAVAGIFLPLTAALRLSGTPWKSLSPLRLAKGVRRITPPYFGVAFAASALLAPAVLVLLFSAGMQAFVAISVAGPLAVVPLLMATRILGLTLHYERERLGGLFQLPVRQPPVKAGARPARPARATR